MGALFSHCSCTVAMVLCQKYCTEITVAIDRAHPSLKNGRLRSCAVVICSSSYHCTGLDVVEREMETGEIREREREPDELRATGKSQKKR